MSDKHYELIKALGRYSFSELAADEIRAMVADPEVDWAKFLGACFLHKVAGLIYWNAFRLEILHQLPGRVVEPLRLFYLANKARNGRLAGVAQATLAALRAQGVDARPLKGVVLVPLIYSDGGSRYLRDVDVFVRRAELDKVIDVLQGLGFEQGTYDRDLRAVRPLSRPEKLLWDLNMFNLPPFYKLVDDGCLEEVGVDISFGLAFGESADVSSMLLEQSEVLGGHTTLAAIDFFIHLCCHLYKEASNEAWVKRRQSLHLIKFCDVREFTLRELRWKPVELVRRRIRQLGVEKPVYFSLAHVHGIYGDPAVAEWLASLQFEFQDFTFMSAIYRQGTKLITTRAQSVEAMLSNPG